MSSKLSAFLFIGVGAVTLTAAFVSDPTKIRTLLLTANGALFCFTGVAIVEQAKIALPMIWIVVAFSALGTLMRGLIPIDILGWLVNLCISIWYTCESHRKAAPTVNSTAATWTTAILALVFATIGFARYRDASSSLQNASHLRDLMQVPAVPEAIAGTLSGNAIVMKRASLDTLNPVWLLGHCGVPITDRMRARRVLNPAHLPERRLVYLAEDKSLIQVVFLDFGHQEWGLPVILDSSGLRYPLDSDQDINHLLSLLPCLR